MRLLVTFRENATAGEVEHAVRSVGGWIDSTIPALGIARIALPGDANDAFGDGDAVARVLAQHPAVASAELDRSVRLSFDPNDQYYRTDPYTGQSLGQWGVRKAAVDRAWDVVRGAATVTVAVLDTGIDPEHPDLAGVLVPGTAFVSQPSSGCEAGATKDDNSHGTHVAGVVAAAGNNSSGIAGVAFGSKLMPVKVLDCTGVGSLSDVANGLVWAVDRGARIVNLSLGSQFDSSTLRAAVTYASSKNVLVVSAAGNCGTTGERCTSLHQTEYPAAYPEVISVGATDTDDTVAFFSTQNATVDVSAPGRRIVSTTPTYATVLSRRATNPATTTYAAFSGTSQAAPFVAGVAALILSGEPTLTPAALFERIRATSDDLGVAGRDNGFGSGRVNAQRAVSAKAVTPAPAPAPIPPVTGLRFSATYAAAASPVFFGPGAQQLALLPRGRLAIPLTITNTGTATWSAAGSNPVRLASHTSDARGNVVTWDGTRTAFTADVAPGASAKVDLILDAPAPAGPYRVRIDLVHEGVAWFSALGVTTTDVDLLVVPDFRAQLPGGPLAVSRADPVVRMEIKNTSLATWTTAGPNPVNVALHWFGATGNTLVWDGPRTALPKAIAPSEIVTIDVRLGAPPAGAAFVTIDLVAEGVSWFGAGSLRPVTLAP